MVCGAWWCLKERARGEAVRCLGWKERGLSELLGVQGLGRGREWGLWSVECVQVQGSRVPGLFLVFVPLIVCTYRTGLENYSAFPARRLAEILLQGLLPR